MHDAYAHSEVVVNPDIRVEIPTLTQITSVYTELYGSGVRGIDGIGFLSRSTIARYNADLSYFVSQGFSQYARTLSDDAYLAFKRYIKSANSLRDWHTQGQSVRFFDRNSVCGVIKTYLGKINEPNCITRRGSRIYLNDDPLTNAMVAQLWDDALEYIRSDLPDDPISSVINYAISLVVTSGPFSKNKFTFIAGENADFLEDFLEYKADTEKDRAALYRSKYVTAEDLPIPVVDKKMLKWLLACCENRGYRKDVVRYGTHPFNMKEFLLTLRKCRFTQCTTDGIKGTVEKVVHQLLDNMVDKDPVYLGKLIPGKSCECYPSDFDELSVKGRFVVLAPSWSPTSSPKLITVVDHLLSLGCIVYWISRVIDWDETPFSCYMYSQVAPMWDVLVSLHVNTLSTSQDRITIGGPQFKTKFFKHQIKSWANAISLYDSCYRSEDPYPEVFVDHGEILSDSVISKNGKTTGIDIYYEPTLPVYKSKDLDVVSDFIASSDQYDDAALAELICEL
jgi:hypothetical protein